MFRIHFGGWVNKEIEKVARNVEEKSRRELAPYLGFPQSVTEQNCQKKNMSWHCKDLHCTAIVYLSQILLGSICLNLDGLAVHHCIDAILTKLLLGGEVWTTLFHLQSCQFMKTDPAYYITLDLSLNNVYISWARQVVLHLCQSFDCLHP